MRRSGIGKNGTAMGSGEEAVLGEMEACRIGGGDELGSDEVDDAGEGWPTSGNERVKKLMASRCSITLRFCSIVECASRRRRASSRNHMRELLVWSGRQLTVSQEPRCSTHSHHDMCVHLTRDLDTGFRPRLSPCRRAERQLARTPGHPFSLAHLDTEVGPLHRAPLLTRDALWSVQPDAKPSATHRI